MTTNDDYRSLFTSMLRYENSKKMAMTFFYDACKTNQINVAMKVAKFFDLRRECEFRELHPILCFVLADEKFDMAAELMSHFSVIKHDMLSYSPFIFRTLCETGKLDAVKFLISFFKITRHEICIWPHDLSLAYENGHRNLIEWVIKHFEYTKRDLSFMRSDPMQIKGYYYASIRKIVAHEMRGNDISSPTFPWKCSICSQKISGKSICWTTSPGRYVLIHNYGRCQKEYEKDVEFWRHNFYVVFWVLVTINVLDLPRELNQIIMMMFLD